MIAFLRLIRIANLLLIALCLSLFYYLIIIPTHHSKLGTTIIPFTHLEFVLFVLSVVCIAASGNIINDYFDFELDKEFKPERPLARGAFTLDAAIYLHGLLAAIGIAIGFYLAWQAGNFNLGYLYIICVLLLYLYSAYLKKIPLLGNVLVAALSAFVLVLLMLFEVQNLRFLALIHFENTGYVLDIFLWQLRFYGGFAFLTSLARELIKDLEDRVGDEAFGIPTLPVRFGIFPAKFTAGLVLLLLLLGGGYFQKLFWEAGATKQFYYLLFAVQVPLLVALGMLYRATEQRDYRWLSLLLKLVMLLGILSIPAFYWFNQ